MSAFEVSISRNVVLSHSARPASSRHFFREISTYSAVCSRISRNFEECVSILVCMRTLHALSARWSSSIALNRRARLHAALASHSPSAMVSSMRRVRSTLERRDWHDITHRSNACRCGSSPRVLGPLRTRIAGALNIAATQAVPLAKESSVPVALTRANDDNTHEQ